MYTASGHVRVNGILYRSHQKKERERVTEMRMCIFHSSSGIIPAALRKIHRNRVQRDFLLMGSALVPKV